MQAVGWWNPLNTMKRYGDIAHRAYKESLRRIGNVATRVFCTQSAIVTKNKKEPSAWKVALRVTLIFMAGGAVISMKHNLPKDEILPFIPVGPLACVERLKTIEVTLKACNGMAPIVDYIKRNHIQLTCDDKEGFSRPWVYADEEERGLGHGLIPHVVVKDYLYCTEPFVSREKEMLRNLCKKSVLEFVEINVQFAYDHFKAAEKLINGCKNWPWELIERTFEEYREDFVKGGYAMGSIKLYIERCSVATGAVDKKNLSYSI